MRTDSTREFKDIQPPVVPIINGVCTLSGYGIKIRVDNQHLVCSDGIADDRREVQLSRATCGLKRLVIIGHTGFITIEAMRWLSKLGVGIAAIDTDANVLMASQPDGADYPHLRRSQALSRQTLLGIEITNRIISTKIEGQEIVTRYLRPDNPIYFSSQIKALGDATQYDTIRSIEGQAAVMYWKCWKDIPVRFTKADSKCVPNHWLTFGTRSSPVTNSPRKAANPTNALLNYLYAILETETVIACHAVGLDPGMGFLHHDQASRNSLALDVMEAVRPQVDEWLFHLLDEHTFRKRDFFEDQGTGCIRLSYDVRTMLTETAPMWARAIAPWVEYVAQRLNNKKTKIPTNLTQNNRSKGRDGIRKGTPIERKIIVRLKPVCQSCGACMEKKNRKFCDKCLPQQEQEAVVKMATTGVDALRKARQCGVDPAHGGEAARKRAETQKERRQKRLEYEMTHDNLEQERLRFVHEIQPKLAWVSLSAVMSATGLSIRYASLIKKGEYVPHPVYYKALEDLLADITPRENISLAKDVR